MSIYIVDYENTASAGLDGIEKLLDSDVVVVFFSENQDKISLKTVEKIRKSKAKTVFKEAAVKLTNENKAFHDALDMQLGTYVGYLMGKYQDKLAQYYIVSKDQGFSFVCQYWTHRGYKLSQISCVAEGNSKDEKAKIDEEVRSLLSDEKDASIISGTAKIIREHKTKDGIYKCLVKKCGEEKGRNIFIKIKPMIKDKK